MIQIQSSLLQSRDFMTARIEPDFLRIVISRKDIEAGDLSSAVSLLAKRHENLRKYIVMA
jgi:hypothetical protein